MTDGTDRRGTAPKALQKIGTALIPTVLPPLPDRLKRLLSGGRAVIVDGNTLDPTLQVFVAALRVSGTPRMMADEDDISASRDAFCALCVSVGGPPAPVRVDELSLPGPVASGGETGARHYVPSGPDPAPLLVFFHGGGYVLGDLDSYDALCRLICHDANIHVLSVDYRLAPEHRAPAAVDDCHAAYRWAVEHAAMLGADPHRIAVGGDSAGGALAAAVAQLARDSGDPLPALQLLIYPWTDIRGPSRSRTLLGEGFVVTARDLEYFSAQYLDGSGIADDDPRVSPLHADDLAGLPPALVFTAGFDPLRDEGDRYAEALREAGVSVDLRQLGSMVHGFVNFKALGGGSSRGIDEMVSALIAHLRRA